MPRHPPNAHNNEHTQTQQLNKHNHDTCGTRRPATTRTPPPNQERRKQERRGAGEPAADREPQNINIKNPSNPTTRARRSFTYCRCSRPLCSSQPTRPHPPHNSLRRGCSAQGAPPQNPTACHAPHPQKPHRKPLRKEVIQPHLPVRLPCYDFVPITGPAFDRSP